MTLQALSSRLDSLYLYSKVSKEGLRLFAVGYHYPENPYQICKCKPTTPKRGAYRDEGFEFEGKTLYYLHQHCIVVKDGNQYTLDSCGWKTITTKERINRYLPKKWHLFQKKHEWFLIREGEFGKPIKFFNGMILEHRPNDDILDGFIIRKEA